MTGSGRLRVLAVSCVIAAAAVLLGGARALAAVHQTEARCSRPVTVARPHEPGHAAAQQRPQGSWRAHTLRAGGCGAWRQVHERMWHRRHMSSAPDQAPANQVPVSRRS